MTDSPSSSDNALPWIEDPRDHPDGMNWVQSLTNPFGETSRVHFTRGWTGLFFIRFIYFFALIMLGAVFAGAGVSDSSALLPPAWVWPLLILVTGVASIVLHIRRLADAKRSPLWALLVALPLLALIGGFFAGIASGGAQYDEVVKQMNAPPAAQSREIEEAAADSDAQSDADSTPENGDETSTGEDSEADSAEEGEQRGQRGDRGRQGPSVDVTAVSQREHAFSTGIQTAQTFWAIPSFFVMLWSLLWVGRLPTGGGTIKSRFAEDI